MKRSEVKIEERDKKGKEKVIRGGRTGTGEINIEITKIQRQKRKQKHETKGQKE